MNLKPEEEVTASNGLSVAKVLSHCQRVVLLQVDRHPGAKLRIDLRRELRLQSIWYRQLNTHHLELKDEGLIVARAQSMSTHGFNFKVRSASSMA